MPRKNKFSTPKSRKSKFNWNYYKTHFCWPDERSPGINTNFINKHGLQKTYFNDMLELEQIDTPKSSITDIINLECHEIITPSKNEDKVTRLIKFYTPNTNYSANEDSELGDLAYKWNYMEEESD